MKYEQLFVLNFFLSTYFFVCTFLRLHCFSSIYLSCRFFSFAFLFRPAFFVHPFFRLVLFRLSTFSSKYFNRESHLLLRFNICPGLSGQRYSVASKRGAFTSERRLEPAIAALVFLIGDLSCEALIRIGGGGLIGPAGPRAFPQGSGVTTGGRGPTKKWRTKNGHGIGATAYLDL